MTLREWLPLVGITLSAFIFNTSEFMPIGLLTDIAMDFGISEARAGLLISIYAWVVMAMSLPLMILCSRIPLRPLLLGVIALFAVSQVLSSISTGYYTLLASRIGVAFAHSVFWSIATPIATRIVPASRQSTAMGMVVTGTSIAMIFGLPMGRFIGLAAGWRMTFACVAVAALAVLVLLAALLPNVEKGEPFTLGQLPGLMSNRRLLVVYVVTILVTTGYYTGYSYIEPFLKQVAGMADALVTVVLAVFGLAGVVGSMLFSRFYDSHRVSFMRVMVLGVAVALLLLGLAGPLPAMAFVACMVWGMSSTAFNLSFQAEVIRVTDDDASAVAMSVYSGLFNLGIGCGTWVGGLVTSGVGVFAVGFAGCVIALAGFALCCRTLARRA